MPHRSANLDIWSHWPGLKIPDRWVNGRSFYPTKPYFSHVAGEAINSAKAAGIGINGKL